MVEISELAVGQHIIIKAGYGLPERAHNKDTVVLYVSGNTALCTNNTLLIGSAGDSDGVSLLEDVYEFLFVKPEAVYTLGYRDWCQIPKVDTVSFLEVNKPKKLETDKAGSIKLEFLNTEELISVKRKEKRFYKHLYWLQKEYTLFFNHKEEGIIPILRFAGITDLAAWEGRAEVELY